MITYNFTNTGSDSLYEYLYKCIKNDILQGNIRPGEKLPSKRSFAKNLGISVITVENAYEQLIAEGYIYSMPKRGFYVTDFKKAIEIEKKILLRKWYLSQAETQDTWLIFPAIRLSLNFSVYHLDKDGP